MRSTQGRPGDVLTTSATVTAGVVLLLLTGVLLRAGWCSCTLFALNSWALIGAAVLLLGNRTFGVLAEEKEKKTLDCLRLTQLSASQLFLFKLRPEFRSLVRLLAGLSPAVLLSAHFSESGLLAGFGVLLIAALGGILSIVLSLFVSSLASSTSRAVVHGWTLKACWLLLTPVLDLVVSAVTVSTERYPVFDAFNPFAAAWPLLVPEAQTGIREHLALAFLLLAGPLAAWMWWVAARRYESGLTAAPTLTDRHVHQIYKKTPNFVPSWLGVNENPVFMRELASQLRSGAGKWPGYAVFVTLFLAPFLYSQSWNVRRSMEVEQGTQLRLQASQNQEPTNAVETAGNPEQSAVQSQPFVRLHSWDGTELRLKGHTATACLRMKLYAGLHVPLPASQVVKVEYENPLAQVDITDNSSAPIDRPGPREVRLTDSEASVYGVANPNEATTNTALSMDTLAQIRRHSLTQGLLGCLVLLSLYLGVRCSGFLANAVTAECDRRSWTDLALTGISPAQVLHGKLAGTLLMPVIQLLVASPSLLLFVLAGAITPLGALQLVGYAALLAVTAGMIGFWASSASPNSHSAHGLALASVISWLVISPVFSVLFGHGIVFPLLGLAALAAVRRDHPTVVLGWLAVAVASFLVPVSLSPWTCLPVSLGAAEGAGFGFLTWICGMFNLAGLTAVCYQSTLSNMQMPGQENTLCADRLAC